MHVIFIIRVFESFSYTPNKDSTVVIEVEREVEREIDRKLLNYSNKDSER